MRRVFTFLLSISFESHSDGTGLEPILPVIVSATYGLKIATPLQHDFSQQELTSTTLQYTVMAEIIQSLTTGKIQELLAICGVGDCDDEPIKQHILGISTFGEPPGYYRETFSTDIQPSP